MPYIDADPWADIKLVPDEGESFQQFSGRVVPGLLLLDSNKTVEQAADKAKKAWAAYVLSHASEVTVTMKRELEHYSGVYYSETYWGDWEVTEVLGGTIADISLSYSSQEIATVGTGEVFKIAKSADDQQLVFGWANIAIDANGNYPIDWDGDITAPSDLEKAAYDFVLKYRATGENHEGEVKGDLVESIMFTKEKQQALGLPEGIVPEGWWVGFHVPDPEVFAKIKTGEYEMFSVQGSAQRLPTGE